MKQIKLFTIIFSMLLSIGSIHAETIIQAQSNTEIEDSYELQSPATVIPEDTAIVDIDISGNTWFMHRFHFTPTFTGAVTMEFTGGSENTNWWLGNQPNTKSFFKISGLPSCTQTVQLIAGETVYGTIYDWYQCADLKLKFTRLAENIVQPQSNTEIEDSYELQSPATVIPEDTAIVNIDISGNTWFMHRFHFTPTFTGAVTMEFAGGSENTNWWLGNQPSTNSFFRVSNLPNCTQTVQVTAGETVYGTIYDWYQVADLKLKFTRLAENIVQIPKSTEIEGSYELQSPATVVFGDTAIVNIDIPGNTWFMHRFHFTPTFTGAVTMKFTGGSETTNWWLGNQPSTHSYFQVSDLPTCTQTVQVTAGETVYGTIYDWYQAADLKLKFTRTTSATQQQKIKIFMSDIQRNGYFTLDQAFKAISDLGFNTVQTREDWAEGGLEAILTVAAQYNIDIIVVRQTASAKVAGFEQELINFANLSNSHGNFIGWCIDDLHPYKTTHADSTLMANIAVWNDTIKNINDKFIFFPTLYFESNELQYLTDPALPDGATMWYWDSWSHIPSAPPSISILSNNIAAGNNIDLPANAKFITGVYPYRGGFVTEKAAYIPNNRRDMDKLFHPTGFVYDMLTAALNQSAGVGIFTMGDLLMYSDPELLNNVAFFNQQVNDDNNFDFKLGADLTGIARTPVGWYQGLSKTVSLTAIPNSATLSFKIKDNMSPGSLGIGGYDSSGEVRVVKAFTYKQLIINDTVIWGGNIFEDGITEEIITLNIANYLQQGDNQISIRSYATAGGSIGKCAVYVDSITLNINNQPVSGFTFTSGIKDYAKFLKIYNEVKQALNDR